MAKSVVYTCDAEGDHKATLQVITHAREETTVYSVATRHACSHHVGNVTTDAYNARSEDVSQFNRKAVANKAKGSSSKGNTKFANITVTEIPVDER